jgi:hypothetical protein
VIGQDSLTVAAVRFLARNEPVQIRPRLRRMPRERLHPPPIRGWLAKFIGFNCSITTSLSRSSGLEPPPSGGLWTDFKGRFSQNQPRKWPFTTDCLECNIPWQRRNPQAASDIHQWFTFNIMMGSQRLRCLSSCLNRPSKSMRWPLFLPSGGFLS